MFPLLVALLQDPPSAKTIKIPIPIVSRCGGGALKDKHANCVNRVKALPEVITANQKFRSASIDAKGSVLTVEVDEGSVILASDIADALANAGSTAKAAGDDVTFALDSKRLTLRIIESRVRIPFGAVDAASHQPIAESLRTIPGATDVFVGGSPEEVNFDLLFNGAKTLTVAEVEDKAKGVKVRWDGLLFQPDGSLLAR